MRIAHNLIADTHRRQTPIVEVKDEKERHRILEGNVTMAVGSAEDELHNAQTYSDLTQMIARLPEPQQVVVRLRIYENRSFKEIADLTKCSINTALGRMRYAVLNLRRMAAQKDLTVVEYD
jgi:RNA polymerase sigma-70 factor (ECF subfamily)